MIELRDKVSLPADVELRGNDLRDLTLGTSYHLNGSAPLFLELLNAGHFMVAIVPRVAQRFGIDEAVVVRDLLQLVLTLNQAQLLNVKRVGVTRRLRAILFAVTLASATGTVPQLRTRYPIKAGLGSVLVIAFAATVRYRLLLSMWLVLALLLGVLVNAQAVFPGALLSEVALIAAITVHEYGHATAVRRRRQGGCFLITYGHHIAVVHGGRPDGWVHAAGPLMGGATGLIFILAAWIIQSPTLGVIAIPFVFQLAGLTVLAKDGRQLIRSL